MRRPSTYFPLATAKLAQLNQYTSVSKLHLTAMDKMDINTAIKRHKIKVNINTTIEVPLETMLAVRNGGDQTVALGPVISASLRSAVIDAIQAYPGSPGDASFPPPISSADLRENDRAASKEAAKGIEEVEEMMRKSLLGDSRYKAKAHNASKILGENGNTQTGPAPNAKTAFHDDIGFDTTQATPAGEAVTPLPPPVDNRGELVRIKVRYKNLSATRRYRDSNTIEEVVADLRASIPEVPDHYQRLIWIINGEAIVLRGSTKLRNVSDYNVKTMS